MRIRVFSRRTSSCGHSAALHARNAFGGLWEEWRGLGVHVVIHGIRNARTHNGWDFPTDPTGEPHLFLCDGYAASAEAIQAASLDPILNQHTSMCVFSSKFETSHEREQRLMRLDPDASDFARELQEVVERVVGAADVAAYRDIIQHAGAAGMPRDKPAFTVDDLFPNKKWRGLRSAPVCRAIHTPPCRV